MTEGNRRAILYARVSTKGQADTGYSLRQQIEACRTWAEAEGYEVLEEVEDAGHSGASLERPGLDRVRDLVQGGGMSVVVAQDRDRFSREPAYLYLLKREFEEYGTKLRALNDRGDESPEGELTDGILDQLAKFERAKMVERSRRGKLRKVSEGKIVAGPRPPFGFVYADDGNALVVDPSQMRVMARIFGWLAVEGLTMGEVVRRLNDEGVPSPMARDPHQETSGLWHKPTVRDLVLNDLYRPLAAEEIAASPLPLDPGKVYGLWGFNKRNRRERGSRDRYERPKKERLVVPVPLSDAGLVRAHVDAARERIGQNGSRRPPSTAAQRFWQLSGGIVRCAECGSALSPRARRRRGRIDSWYACRQRYDGSGARDCTHTRSYRADVLEETIWRAVYGLISDPERLGRQHKQHVERKRREMRGDPDREARDLAEKLERLERRRSNYIDLAADGLMSREDLWTKLAEADRQREELQEALLLAQGRQQSIEEMERAWHIAGQMLQLTSIAYVTVSPEDRRRFYMALQLRVEIGADGTITLRGIFDPEIRLLDLIQDPPIDPSEPAPKVPEETRVVVTTPYTPYSSGLWGPGS